jgi:hypothetical protein
VSYFDLAAPCVFLTGVKRFVFVIGYSPQAAKAAKKNRKGEHCLLLKTLVASAGLPYYDRLAIAF